MSSDAVVAFFSGGPDSEGRTLDDILSWDDDRLEAVHDYIQWLFPSRQPSAVNRFAPIATDATVRAFERDGTLRAGLRRAFERMLRFYGFHVRDGRVEIDDRRFATRARIWLHAGNHNHLRLTRIMDALSTLGLRDEALALQRCLIDDVCAGPGTDRVTPHTLEFWRRAVSARTE